MNKKWANFNFTPFLFTAARMKEKDKKQNRHYQYVLDVSGRH